MVPVIAKADCLGKQELVALKRKILDEIDANGIKIYQVGAQSQHQLVINLVTDLRGLEDTCILKPINSNLKKYVGLVKMFLRN